MANKLKAPSEKTIRFLYQGTIAFYPDVATAVFSLSKQDRSPSVFWGGFDEPNFESFLLNITGGSTSVDEAAGVVRNWMEGSSPEKTIPENLDELVEDLDEANKETGASVKKINLARKATIESQKFVEKDEDFFVRLTPSVLKTFEQAAQGAVTFPLKVTSFFATPRYREENPNASVAVSSAINLATLERATKTNSSLSDKERAKILAFVETFKKARYSFIDQLKTEQLRASVHGIVFANGSDLGLSQAEWFVLLEPSPSYQSSGGRTSLFKGLFQQIFGNATERVVTSAANKVFGEAVKKVAGEVVVKAGGKILAEVVGGVVLPGIGAIVAYIIIELAPKILGWLKRNLNKIVGVILIAGALLVGGPIGLLMGVGGALSFVGTTGLGAAATFMGNGLSFGITNILLPSIGLPILISLISIPIVVALILFIINSGAYIVPPSSLSQSGENPHIGVVKEASPAGPFKNSDLPLTISYTIAVMAKRGSLTNIKFEHKCEVLQKGAKSVCPSPLPGSLPLMVSPDTPYVFNYTETYSGATYKDALVLNTFTVTADTPETKNETASGAASIIIGAPPTGCYNVAGSWPSVERANITAAVTNLVGSAIPFVSKLCSAWPQVNLYYDPPRVCGVWGCAPGGNTIYFNSGGLKNVSSASYILAHESSHVLAYGIPSLYQSYLAFSGTLSELPVCSYGGSSSAEGFAEAIARFATHASCLDKEVNNKKFVETKIFR